MTFEKWLEDNAKLRGEIIAFSKVAVLDTTKAIEMSEACGLMENEADSYCKLQFAIDLRNSKTKYLGYAAKEREVFVRADLAQMFKFAADLQVIGRTIRDRIYNQNRR